MNQENNQQSVPEETHPLKKGYQFGTFQGVFTPSILTILGVVMYLRFGWVLGNVGLGLTLVIVTIATSITFLTALSISGLATSMKVRGGGAYYIISRSLGIETGAAIGLPLFIAQTLGIAFYVSGFSESVANLFPVLSAQTVGIATLVLLTVLAFFSADLALKMQYFILAMIFASLVSFFAGSASAQGMSAPGVVLPLKLPFWAVFAVFFPAVTGIEAGLSMSGDLKNPEKSLPWGTLSAIIVSYFIYLAIPIFLSTMNIDEKTLLTNSLIMRDVGRWGPLVICGLWGASLSSALGALLGAPRTLQALARDGVIPPWIGKGFGKQNDPRFATAVSFAVALMGILLGDLNVIAPVLSMFFLTSYGLLNFSAAFGGMMNNPSWRPKFRVHWKYSLAGACGCLMVMLMINPAATFMAGILSGSVYYFMRRRQMNAYWGDMRYGILMFMIRTALYELVRIKPHEQTWRPNILVLSGSPSSRWYLIALADALSHGKGFLTVTAVLPEQVSGGERINNMQESIQNYLEDRRVPAIVKVVTAENVVEGAKGLIENYGFGPLLPNTILLGDVENQENFNEYASLLLAIFRRQRNLIIVREQDDFQDVRSDLKIDLWWRRVGDNSGLMLALGYLLSTSPEGEGSRLVIKTIVDTEEEKDEQLKQLQAFISEANMVAEINVYIRQEEEIYEMIRRYSSGADLIFVGMRPPDPDETAESYSEYYSAFHKNLDGLPSTVMVLTSEKIDFNRIFILKEFA